MLAGYAYAARLSGLWHKVIEALSSRDRLLAPHADNHSEHSDAELLLLEARWRVDDDYERLLRDATRCTLDETALSYHRIKAGVLGLIFADNCCDAATASAIHNTLTAIPEAILSPRGVTSQRVADLIYHSSYGELSQAVTVAHHLTELAHQSQQGSERIQYLSWASIPLRRSGMFAEATALVREALDIAERRQFASAASSAADTLATIMLEQNKLDAASQWYERATFWVKAQEGTMSPRSISMLGAKLALFSGELEAAKHLMIHSLGALLADGSVRRRNEGLALLLRYELAAQVEPLSGVAVEALLVGHLRARQHGGQDYPTSTLVLGLKHLNRIEDARALLVAYVERHRREITPLPEELSALFRTRPIPEHDR